MLKLANDKIIIDENTGIMYDHTGKRIAKVTDWAYYNAIITLVGGIGNVVPTYSSVHSRYKQVDDLVHVCIHLEGDGGNEGAGTGQINISLPIQAGINTSGDGVGMTGYIVNGINSEIMNGNIDVNGTTIKLKAWKTTKQFTDVIGSDQDQTNRTISLHFWYESAQSL